MSLDKEFLLIGLHGKVLQHGNFMRVKNLRRYQENQLPTEKVRVQQLMDSLEEKEKLEQETPEGDQEDA